MRRQWLDARRQRREVALADDQHPPIWQFDDIATQSQVSQVSKTCGQGKEIKLKLWEKGGKKRIQNKQVGERVCC